MAVGAERNESLVEGGQQGIKMNFGAELADSNLTLIYASAAGCKFTPKIHTRLVARGWLSPLSSPTLVRDVTYKPLNRNKWGFYDARKLRLTAAAVRRIDGIFHKHFA